MDSNDQKKQPEKKQEQPKKNEIYLSGEEGEFFLKRNAFYASPMFMFCVLLVPIFLGILFAFTAKPPEQTPVAVPQAETHSAPPASTWTADGEVPVRTGKAARWNDAGTAPVIGGVAFSKTGCNFKTLVGNQVTGDMRRRFEEAGRVYRVLPPGSAMTMDFSVGRVNLELDDKGVIRRVWCG